MSINAEYLSDLLLMPMPKGRMKFSKADLYGLIQTLLDEEQGAEKLQDLEKAALLQHFMPSLPAKLSFRDKFAHCAKAAAKKDIREYMNYVYCNGERIVATDGHMLVHHSNDDDLEMGFYHPKTKEKISLDHRYPDYERLFDYKNAISAPIHKFTITSGTERNGKEVLQYYRLSTEKADYTVPVDRKLWDVVIANDDKATIYIRGEQNAVIVEHSNGGKGIVMPLRIKLSTEGK